MQTAITRVRAKAPSQDFRCASRAICAEICLGQAFEYLRGDNRRVPVYMLFEDGNYSIGVPCRSRNGSDGQCMLIRHRRSLQVTWRSATGCGRGQYEITEFRLE
jgi:hypothetical protein